MRRLTPLTYLILKLQPVEVRLKGSLPSLHWKTFTVSQSWNFLLENKTQVAVNRKALLHMSQVCGWEWVLLTGLCAGIVCSLSACHISVDWWPAVGNWGRKYPLEYIKIVYCLIMNPRRENTLIETNRRPYSNGHVRCAVCTLCLTSIHPVTGGMQWHGRLSARFKHMFQCS